MRVDANVSVRPVGATELGLRCEIKNVNSLRSLVRAIEYEARRQVDVLEAGERVRQETRHWDEEAGRTRAGRSKEDAEDYRYFLEPDLVVIDPSAEWIAEIAAALPVLPAERRARLADAAGVRSGRRGHPRRPRPRRPGPGRHRGRRRPGPGAHPRRAQPGRRRGRRRSTSPTSPSWCASSSTASSPPPRPRPVLAEMVETGQAPEAIAKAHGFEAMDSRRPRGDRRRRHRRQPRRLGRVRGRPTTRARSRS